MKRKFLAAMLAAAVMVTSIQLPATEVKAEGTETDSNLTTLMAECETVFQNEGLYKTADANVALLWDAFEDAYKEAKAAEAAGNGVTEEQLTALSAAKTELDTDANKRIATLGDGNALYVTPSLEEQINNEEINIYREGDRFQFPTLGETKILEMEYLQMENVVRGTGWNLQVTSRKDGTESNGKVLNALNVDDKAYLYYNVERAGIYTATLRYRSGSTSNSFVLQEEGRIYCDNVVAGASDGGVGYYEKEFTFEVLEAGDGMITVVPGTSNAPVMDKMEITAKALDLNVTVEAGEHISITRPEKVRSNESATFRITPDSNYAVSSVTVDGEKVDFTRTGAEDHSVTVTLTKDADFTIAATSEWYTYTENDRFEFPATANATAILEMEWLQLNKDRVDTGDWPARLCEVNDASNGYMIYDLDDNDALVLYYNAPRKGTYSAVLHYRSGDSRNTLVWNKDNVNGNKIEPGQVSAAGGADGGNHPNPGTTQYETTFSFEVLEAGEGTLTFAGTSAQAPRLDKIVIKADPYTYNVTKTVVKEEEEEEEHGTITAKEGVINDSKITEGQNAVFTITPNTGYVVKSVTVNNKPYEVNAWGGDITITNPTEDVTISAEFEKAVDGEGWNAALTDNILMKHYLKLNEKVSASELTVQVSADFIDAEENKSVGLTELETIGQNDLGIDSGCFVVKCEVPAKNMGTTITVSVKKGESEIYQETYNVNEYLNELKKSGENLSAKENAMNLLVESIENFGVCAEKYFDDEDYDADTDKATTVTAADLTAYIPTFGETLDTAKVYYEGSSLLLESSTSVRHYFNDDVGKIDEYSKGTKKLENGSTYTYFQKGIAAHQLGIMEKITLSIDGKDFTLEYCPLSYAYLVLGLEGDEQQELKNVMGALYEYSQAAQNYLVVKGTE